MPAIPPGSLVLVTGASGFIAAHTVKAFLNAGFPVRGTVRSPAKGDYLKNLFKDSKVPFEYVIVEDIGKPGAFDEAVKDVVGVAHTASPFRVVCDDPNDFILPAVNGTVGVLKSIQKNNPDVKRVVITSSVAAVLDGTVPPPHTFTEKDWNEHSTREVEKLGREAAGGDKYRASKTLAEKAFWKFIEDEKPAFDGATVNPPLVLGEIIHPISKLSELNQSNQFLWDWFAGNKTEADIPTGPAPFNWISVHDVAKAHVRALAVPEAGGERFIVSKEPVSPNDYVLSFARHFPDRKTYPKGDPAKSKGLKERSTYFDGSKAERVLGLKYDELDPIIHETIQSIIDRLDA